MLQQNEETSWETGNVLSGGVQKFTELEPEAGPRHE